MTLPDDNALAQGLSHRGRCGRHMYLSKSRAAALHAIIWAMRTVLGTLIVAAFATFVLVGCDSGAPTKLSASGCDSPSASAVCRVLFIGNSYTYVNNLPRVFAKLAAAGNHVVKTGVMAHPDASLANDAASSETEAVLKATSWDVVVLQEQSEIPSSVSLRQTLMYPAARRLVHMIREHGTEPIFYLTWAHQAGWPANGLIGYLSMQSAIDAGYFTIARELGVAVAPVGDAWSAILSRKPHPRLWQADGSHPTIAGTYLAACVFYATIFRQSPKGLSYHADLSDSQAAKLQAIAPKIVFAESTN